MNEGENWGALKIRTKRAIPVEGDQAREIFCFFTNERGMLATRMELSRELRKYGLPSEDLGRRALVV